MSRLGFVPLPDGEENVVRLYSNHAVVPDLQTQVSNMEVDAGVWFATLVTHANPSTDPTFFSFCRLDRVATRKEIYPGCVPDPFRKSGTRCLLRCKSLLSVLSR